MMNKTYSKRLKMAIKDAETYACFAGGTFGFGAVGTFFTSVLFPNNDWVAVGWGLVIGFLVSVAVYLKLTVFSEESKYAKHILEKESEKMKIEKNEEQKTPAKQLWEVLSVLGEENTEIKLKVDEINTKIMTTIEKYPIDEKEEHYLKRTLQNDILKTIRLFTTLNKENQEEMKPTILQTLDKIEKDLKEKIVIPYENQIKKELKQQITLIEAREV